MPRFPERDYASDPPKDADERRKVAANVVISLSGSVCQYLDEMRERGLCTTRSEGVRQAVIAYHRQLFGPPVEDTPHE